MVSSALGASRVLVCGHHTDKLQEIVEACPRAEILNVKRSGDYNQVAEEIRYFWPPRQHSLPLVFRGVLGGPANCSIDTTGAQDAVSSCIRATQSGEQLHSLPSM